MTERAQAVLTLLRDRKIQFDIVEHDPVYTIDEMLRLNLPHAEAVAKNLFLRDDKKRNYYLLVVREEKKVDLKALKEKIVTRPLSFASEGDLNQLLGLTKGSVTPFGILNDEDRRVKVLIDQSFWESLIGVHPNENTATVWMQIADLAEILEEHGNSVEFVEI